MAIVWLQKFTMMKRSLAALLLAALVAEESYAFAPPRHGIEIGINRPAVVAVDTRQSTCLYMALDDAMKTRLDGIRRSYQALTERLADPDVIGNSTLLRQVMKDRSQSEEVVMAFDEYCRLDEELEGANELFQEAGDDAEMREMARSEIKTIEAELEDLEIKVKILLLPKDPNDDRNCMLEIRAGTGGSEANIFAGELLNCATLHVNFLLIEQMHSHHVDVLGWIYKGICMMSIANSWLMRGGKCQ